MELAITFCILGISIILFMSNKVRPDLVALLAMLALVLSGVLTTSEALAGFANSIVIMVAGLFVISAGIQRTGLAKMAAQILLRFSGSSEVKLFIFLLMIASCIGSFMSNSGTVAIMIPIVISIAQSIKVSPSKFLIPLSFVASLSGLLTLIASSPNLIVSQTLLDNGFEKLSFFQITPIGIIGTIAGIIFLTATRNFLLPYDNQGEFSERYKLSPKQLATDYKLRGNLFRVEVPNGSKIIGKSLADLKIPHKYQLCVLKIERKTLEGIKLLPITYQEMAGPTSIIQGNDILYLQGPEENVKQFSLDFQLTVNYEKSSATELVSKELGIAEVLLPPHSRFINETIQSIGFREKYNLNIIGINRQGKYVLQNMSEEHLRLRDTLLVQGSWKEIEHLAKDTRNVVVIGQPEEQAKMASANGKAPIAGIIMLLMIGLMVFEVFPVVISVLIGAVLMILTGCLRNMDDAYESINWETIILVACMLPMTTALDKTGGMVILSEGIIQLLGPLGSMGVLAGLYLLTVIFGQFISNTATAILFAPIAMNAAISMGANPYTFLIAIAVASNMAFATPVASPTNALVMAAGNYKFSDFVKIGVPMQLVMFIVMMIAIPIFFPL